jgi:hypothetical protein
MKFCAFLLGFIACLGACSAKDTSDPYASVPEFCTAWGKAACNSTVVTRCSGMPTATSALTDVCVEKQGAFCEGLVNKHTGYNSAQAKTCLDAVGHAYGDATLSGTEIATVRQLGGSCNHLFKGPQAKGDSCTADADCDTVHNVQCVMKSGVGTCVVPTVVANGTSCSAPEASCMTGFYCDGAHCVQSEAAGDKCDADYECGTGLSCVGVGDGGAATGKCATRVDPRMCAADADCTTGVCDIVGSDATGTCIDSITLSHAESLCEDLR